MKLFSVPIPPPGRRAHSPALLPLAAFCALSALAVLVPSAASAQSTSAASPLILPPPERRTSGGAPVVDKHQGASLERSVWRFVDGDVSGGAKALAQLPPGGSTPTTLPFSAPGRGGVAWMYTDFLVAPLSDKDGGDDPKNPLRKLLGSAATFGGFLGGAQVFLNGEKVGAAAPGASPDQPGEPSRHVLPGRLLKYGGSNRLAVRLEARGAKSTPVGLPVGPVTLSALDWIESKQRIEEISAELEAAYSVLYRAAEAGFSKDSAFHVFNNDVQDLQALLIRAERSHQGRRPNLVDEMVELEQLASDVIARRKAIHVKTLARRQIARRDGAPKLEQRFGLEPGSLHVRPDSFGRFGEFEENGLPALWSVTPVSARPAPGAGFAVRLDRLDRVDALEVAWDHKISRVMGLNTDPKAIGREGAALEDAILLYHMRASSLFPGVMIDAALGRNLALEIDAPGPELGVFQFAVPGPEFGEAVLARYIGAGGQAETPEERNRLSALMQTLEREPRMTLIVPRRAEASPMLLIHQLPHTMTLRQSPDHPEKTLAVFTAQGPRLGRVVAVFPQGRNLMDATPVKGERPEDFLRRAFGHDYPKLLATFFRYGASFPMGVEEWYSVDREAGVVHCVDVCRHLDLFPPAEGAPRPIVLPPMAVQAQRAGYPVELPEDFKLALSVPGAEGTLYMGESRTHLVKYTLPLPPLGERALPWTPGHEDWKALMGECVEQARAINSGAKDILGAAAIGRRQAYQAYSFLDEDSRNILRSMDDAGRAAFENPLAWRRTTERFSGLSFQSAFSTEGPLFERYNLDLGNALLLDALYHQAKYSGDWEWPRANAETIRSRLLEYFVAADDWGWMRAGTTIGGESTGGGENMNATFAGLRAAALLMEGAGNQESADLAFYLLARASLPTLQRFRLADYARRNNLLAENEAIAGFREGKGFVTAPLHGNPAAAAGNLSAQGPHPAVLDFLLAHARDDLDAYTEAVAEAWPRWYRAQPAGQERGARGQGPGRSTLPMIYARARLGESPAIVEQYVQLASNNREDWWMAPVALAEAMAGPSETWVENWGRLGFAGASLDGGRLHVDFEVPASAVGEVQRLAVHAPQDPSAAWLNFQRLPAPFRDPATGRIAFDYVPDRAGPAALTLDWASLPAPGPGDSRFVPAARWSEAGFGGGALAPEGSSSGEPFSFAAEPAAEAIDFSAESMALEAETLRREEEEALRVPETLDPAAAPAPATTDWPVYFEDGE